MNVNYKYIIDRDSLVDLRVALSDLIDRMNEDVNRQTSGYQFYIERLQELQDLKKKTTYINLQTIEE